MYRHLLTLLAMLSFIGVSAQETHVIEPANMEVRYVSKYEGDYIKKYGSQKDVFVLRCGSTVSQYFSRNKFRSDSLCSTKEGFHVYYEEHMAALKRYQETGEKITYLPGYGDYYYRKMADGVVTMYTNMLGEGFCIVDTPTVAWNVVLDSVKEVAGYECHMATAKFRGREWHAWFTFDIPLSVGPWKLAGLPGLILKAEVPGFLDIEAAQILTKNLQPVTFYNYYEKKFTNIGRIRFMKKHNPSAYPKGTLMTPEFEEE